MLLRLVWMSVILGIVVICDHQGNLVRNQPLKSYNPNKHSYYYHRDVMRQICHKKPSHTQYNFQKIMKKCRIHNRYFHTYKQSVIGYFMRNICRMHKNDIITTLWVMCQLRSKNQFTTKHKSISRPTSNTVQHQNDRKVHIQLRGRNQTKRNLRTHHTQVAYMSQHDLAYKNSFPVTNLEKGWIIDSGASAHMTPFRKRLPRYTENT